MRSIPLSPIPIERRHLHILLALLLLANGLLTVVQGGGHALTAGIHGHAADHHTTKDHHRHVGDHDELHHIAAIDGGTDEHGHHFHVHLPAHALVSSITAFEYTAAAAAEPAPSQRLPFSQTYAPPVPPPNA